MIDTSFDFDLWLKWGKAIAWGLNGLGLATAMTAFVGYKFNSKANTTALSLLVLAALWILLGFFPIEWGYNTDRANYANEFLNLQRGGETIRTNDFGFVLLTSFLGRFLTVQHYFAATALIYLTNYFIAIRRLTRNKSFWLVVAVALSMGFTGYVTNTMRAGLAISFIVLAFSQYPSKWKMTACMFVAVTIHNSVSIPALIIALCYFFGSTKLYYKLWLLAIPVSFVAGGFFMSFFSGMTTDARTQYLSGEMETTYNVGFRIDFIIYSLVPMAVGYFYIFKKNFTDAFYRLLYNSYLLTNIFWILVIRANYSDRFAYLSWFMIPFVLVYPLLKQKLALSENTWLGMILLGETCFRFLI